MRVLLVVYDNDSYIHTFPQGLAYIAAALKKNGYDVVIYNQDIDHLPDEHLTEHLNKNKYDFIGLSFIGGYYQYRKALKISEAINNSKNRPFFILGGHGPSPEPEFFIKKTNADAVVIGEGEETIIELIYSVINKISLNNVKGIAYRNGDEVVINERRELIKNIDSLSWPEYNLFPIEYYRLIRWPHAASRDFVMPVLSGRGCTFRCNFCYRMDKGFRPRSNESIIEEVKYLIKDYRISYINFSDELLMSSEKRVVDFCNDLIKTDLKIKWDCNGRLNYATPEVLNLMKKSGCVFINYGIESYDDEMLKKINKALTTDQIKKGIEATLEAGISPGYNIIFGNIGETKEVLMKGVEFLLKYDDGSQMRTIRPVTPYPGSALYYHAIEKGLLEGPEDFYEKKHLNSDLLAVNFTDLSDNEFHDAMYEANEILLNNYFRKKEIQVKEQLVNLYKKKDVSFRGFRQT